MGRLLACACLVLLVRLPILGMAIDDLRLEYMPSAGREFQAGGTVNSLDFSNGQEVDNVQGNVSTNASRHSRSALGFRESDGELRAGYGALIWGFELADDLVREHQSNLSYRGRSEMIDGLLGWGWRITRNWHLEQAVFLGVGRSRWSQNFTGFYDDGTSWDDETESFTYEYGFELGSYYTFPASHLQCGLYLRQLVMSSHARFQGRHDSVDPNAIGDTTTVTASTKINVEGIVFGGGIGYRF